MRVPTEVIGLRFKDFDFEEKIFYVGRDTKTGASQVSLFREVRDIFVTLKDESDELVFAKCSCHSYRSFMERALQRADMEQWEKLWVNLRSCCITDLSRLGYDERTLDSIFGNSSAIRKLHYIQFERRKLYVKVLEDNERMCSEISVTTIDQREFDLLLQEVRLLRELLVSGGISVPSSVLVQEN